MDNTFTQQAKNSAGTYEIFLWPRWSDNVMYLNYGSGGFHIRNNNSQTAMFMRPDGRVGIGTFEPVTSLHINSGDPRTRMTQAGTSGYMEVGRAGAWNNGFAFVGLNNHRVGASFNFASYDGDSARMRPVRLSSTRRLGASGVRIRLCVLSTPVPELR